DRGWAPPRYTVRGPRGSASASPWQGCCSCGSPDPDCGTQPHGDRTGVPILFFFCRELCSPDQQPQLWSVLGQLDRKTGGGARCRLRGEDPLDEAVLERLVGENDDPAIDRKRVESGRDCGLEHRELLVDLDAQRL